MLQLPDTVTAAFKENAVAGTGGGPGSGGTDRQPGTPACPALMRHCSESRSLHDCLAHSPRDRLPIIGACVLPALGCFPCRPDRPVG